MVPAGDPGAGERLVVDHPDVGVPVEHVGDHVVVEATAAQRRIQLGQGKENARNFLRDNPDVAAEIEKRIKEKLGVGVGVADDSAGPAMPPVDF